MREKDWAYCQYSERPRREVAETESTLRWRGRVACRLEGGRICSAYNDADGRLLFEIADEESKEIP